MNKESLNYFYYVLINVKEIRKAKITLPVKLEAYGENPVEPDGPRLVLLALGPASNAGGHQDCHGSLEPSFLFPALAPSGQGCSRRQQVSREWIQKMIHAGLEVGSGPSGREFRSLKLECGLDRRMW